jgi:hypothetical protein
MSLPGSSIDRERAAPSVRSSNDSPLPGGVDGRCAVAPCSPPYGSQREWLPTVAFASGLAVVGHSARCLAAGGVPVSEGLDAQLGRFAFDMGNLAVSALTSAE